MEKSTAIVNKEEEEEGEGKEKVQLTGEVGRKIRILT